MKYIKILLATAIIFLSSCTKKDSELPGEKISEITTTQTTISEINSQKIEDTLLNDFYLLGEKVSFPCLYKELPKNLKEKLSVQVYDPETNSCTFTEPSYFAEYYIAFALLDCNGTENYFSKTVGAIDFSGNNTKDNDLKLGELNWQSSRSDWIKAFGTPTSETKYEEYYSIELCYKTENVTLYIIVSSEVSKTINFFVQLNQ